MTSVLTFLIITLLALMVLGMFKPAVALPKFLANKALPGFLLTRLQHATENPTREQVFKLYLIVVVALSVLVKITPVLTLMIVTLVVLMVVGMFKPAAVLPKFLVNWALPKFLLPRLQLATDNPTRKQVLKWYSIVVLPLILLVAIFGASAPINNSRSDVWKSSSDANPIGAKETAYQLRATALAQLRVAESNHSPMCEATVSKMNELLPSFDTDLRQAKECETNTQKYGSSNCADAVYSSATLFLKNGLNMLRQNCNL